MVNPASADEGRFEQMTTYLLFRILKPRQGKGHERRTPNPGFWRI
jgi:hypothetical protein